MSEEIMATNQYGFYLHLNPVSQLESLLNQTLGFFVRIESVIVRGNRVWVRIFPSTCSELYIVYEDSGMMSSIVVLTNNYLHALKLREIVDSDATLLRAPNQEYVIVYDEPSYKLLGKILEFEKMILLN